jgi:hypothetical protein
MKENMSVRDDFTQQTLDILAKRVGVRCSNPECRKLTTGPRSDTTKIVNIGVGAHITGAATGGPRFDETLSSDQRKSPDNGIWLCQNCAKLIDNDPNRYTIDLLKTWKQLAENAALIEIEGGVVSPENLIDLEIAYKKLKIESERHDYLLEVMVRNLSDEQINAYHVDLEFPTCVVERPDKIKYYVQERSNRNVSFFRAVYQNGVNVIYPGDTRLVLSLPYFMDNEIYTNRGNLLDQLVRATFYRKDFQPLAVEKVFDDLENF